MDILDEAFEVVDLLLSPDSNGIRAGDEVAKRMTGMLARYHVLKTRMNDGLSAQAWTNLVTFYDFDHSVFLASDLDALAHRRLSLDDELKAGNVSFGFDVFNL